MEMENGKFNKMHIYCLAIEGPKGFKRVFFGEDVMVRKVYLNIKLVILNNSFN